MDELREKIARLPAWARQHIAMLQERCDPIRAATADLQRKREVAEERARKLQDRLDAVIEIMQYAAKGGSETAKAFVERVLESWGLSEAPVGKEEEERE